MVRAAVIHTSTLRKMEHKVVMLADCGSAVTLAVMVEDILHPLVDWAVGKVSSEPRPARATSCIMFCGLFCRRPPQHTNERTQAHTLLAALTPHHTPDQQGTWQDERFLLVQANTFNTPESRHEQLPHRCPRTGRLIAAWARLDNRSELRRSLKIAEPLGTLTDPALILAAYDAWGSACVARLEGDFAFVILDPRQGEVFAGRDSLGVKPLFYYLDDQLFAFATAAASLRQIAGVDTSVDEAWLVRNLSYLSMSYDRTAMRRIHKLPPAHHLTVTSAQEHLQRYHEFVDDAPWTVRRDSKWVAQYRQTLDTAVAARLRTSHAIGCESSGGLDSSSVLALIAQQSLAHDELHAFGMAFCVDEPRHILTTSQHLGIRHNHIITQRGTPSLSHIDHALDVLGYPPDHSGAACQAPFYDPCRRFGIRTLFSGFGGDETVTNPGHLLLTELWRHRAWFTLWRTMPGIWPLRGVRLLRHWQHQRRPQRFNPNIHRALVANLAESVLRDDAIVQYDLCAELDAHGRYDAGHPSINRFILDNRLAAFVPTRLESCTLMAASYGIEYRWPLLDRRLIQQYLSTPAIEKHGPTGRYLHRRAVADVVPADILWKPKTMGDMMPATMDIALEQNALTKLIHPESLHPALSAIVDNEKLKHLHSGAATPSQLRQLRQVVLLQRWLERFY